MRKGFTLTDLLTTIAMLGLLLGVALPCAVSRNREASNRIKCASNLRQIGLAMLMYANDEARTNSFPRAPYDAGNPTPTWASASDYNDPPTGQSAQANPFTGPGQVAPNDVTAAAFLLLRTQDITTDVFCCPSTDQDGYPLPPGTTIQSFTNWTAGYQSERSIGRSLGYSFQNPYPSQAAIAAGFQYSSNLSADIALVADINPGTPALLTTPRTAPAAQLRAVNTPNHEFVGQNVLYADGHVDWTTSPFAGAQGDNIYTAGGPPSAPGGTSEAIVAPPAGAGDSILLPTWPAGKPLPTPVAESRVPWFAIGIIAVCLAAVAVAALMTFLVVRSAKQGQARPTA